VTFRLSARSVLGILLDIEGTTTPIDFVYEVLFPYARAHVKEYLRQNLHSEQLSDDLVKLREEHEADVTQKLFPPSWRDEPVDARIDSIVDYVLWLMDRDRKSTALKSLQGKIWQQGYLTGKLKGRVFPDVPPALDRWYRLNLDLRTFSSGSVLAQKLLLSHTEAGDLTKFLRGYFDTTTGPKTSEGSYRQIATELGMPISAILFISDVTLELDAAKSAGMPTLLCVRPGNRPQPLTHGHGIIHRFSEIID
jgi:enolase-phosphatase E1